MSGGQLCVIILFSILFASLVTIHVVTKVAEVRVARWNRPEVSDEGLR